MRCSNYRLSISNVMGYSLLLFLPQILEFHEKLEKLALLAQKPVFKCQKNGTLSAQIKEGTPRQPCETPPKMVG